MNKNAICEALYALPDGVVVRRRKPFFVWTLVWLSGMALLVANGLLGGRMGNDLSSALVLIGGAAVSVSSILLAVRIFSKEGVPFHRPSRRYLQFKTLYFDFPQRDEVVERVLSGCAGELLQMPHAQVPSLCVALYRTPDHCFVAMQAFEYAELEYRPLTPLRIVGLTQDRGNSL